MDGGESKTNRSSPRSMNNVPPELTEKVGKFLNNQSYGNFRETDMHTSKTLPPNPPYRFGSRYKHEDEMWQSMFRRFGIARRRRIAYARTSEPMQRFRPHSETDRMSGFEVFGDEMLRGKAFRKYAKKRMAAVRFLRPGVPYLTFKHATLQEKLNMRLARFELSGATSYFFRLLVQHFGNDFDDLEIQRPGVRYLGSPGRQGIAILITDETTGLDYVFKLAHSVGAAGTGTGLMTRSQMRKERRTWGGYTNEGGTLGFIAQAKFQMISAMHNCTVPVYACGVADDPNAPAEEKVPISFMVMPPLKMLAHKYAEEKTRVYSGALVERHVAAKYYNLMLRMDTRVGIMHNDPNTLNVMVDQEDDILLIDFDRASFIRHSNLQKWGLYVNLEIQYVMVYRGIFAKIRHKVYTYNDRRIRSYANQLLWKDVDVRDYEVTRLNTRKTPAEVPVLRFKYFAGDLAARLPDGVRSHIFGVQDSRYAGLRF